MKPCITALIVTLIAAGNEGWAEETKSFPNHGWMSWLQVDYPASFVIDLKSLEGEAKWWAKFDSPNSDLSFEIAAFGHVSELDLILTIPGITHENYPDKIDEKQSVEDLIAAEANCKNIGDYFRTKILPDGSEESKFPSYERFIHKKNDCVIIFFLDNQAYKETSGRYYQTLTFNFKKGNYDTHQKVIDEIIASAKPPYQNSANKIR